MKLISLIWWLWRQKQVSQAGRDYGITHYSVGCNYLSLPEIPATGAKALMNDHTCPSVFQVLMYQDARTTFDMSQPSTYCGLATPKYVMNLCQQISFSVVYNMEIHVSSSKWNYSPKQRKPGDHDICNRDPEFEKKLFWMLMIFVVVAIETLNQNKKYSFFKQWWYSTMQATISDTTDAQMAYTQWNHTCDTVKPVCNDHLYNKVYYLWFIQ